MRLETERLILRRWEPRDLDPFARMSADPEIMDWLGGVLTRDEAAAYMARSEASFDTAGMGRFAIERRSDGVFLGSSGLMPGRENLPMAPFIDIGWRLAREAWGHGYAQEAARAVARDGFERLGFDEILAVTTATNRRSRAVMERVGFTYDPGRDFEWPSYPPGDPMRPTVVYAARRS
ncbi:MAG TPA: GNAT family N-acetyltransferase [Phenylobacterium sp.]|nr:GNAT family N-acetyltransferase [Phenylobacterium sp.]